MIKWLKGLSKQEKLMVALIVVLLIGVVLRWGFIKSEAGEALRQRIEHFMPGGQRDSLAD